MKILITGGCGFIGSHLAQKFDSLGHKVIIIDNNYTGNFCEFSPNVNVLRFSLVDINEFESQVIDFNPNVVIHAAATYSEPDNWLLDVNNNIIGTINIIAICKKINLTKLIFLQTSLCYGVSLEKVLYNNNSPYFLGGYSGGTSYAISKTAAELYLSISNIDFISFRLANIFGPRNYTGPIPIFFQNIKNNKKSVVINSVREFLYIDDLVNCIVLATESKINSGFYNISSGVETSILSLFDLIAKQLKVINLISLRDIKNPFFDDTVAISLDSSSTKIDFSWEPKVNFEQGLTKTIKWYEDFGISNTFTHLKIHK